MNNYNQDELYKKASLCTGKDFWHTRDIQDDNIPSLNLSDGPHGLRKQQGQGDHLGVHDSITAICFPSASAIACSFNKQIAYEMGNLLGQECRSEGVNILLGPAINIKRSPLCGRNFEYYSEDPYLTGELAYNFVQGVQKHNVGVCVKHYVANNQETRRMSISANIDETTLREIYLYAFEKVIEANPISIMSSYNKVNGEYVGESAKFLTNILRKEWGFNGIVVSDWYAVGNRVACLQAGLDLEMPGGEYTGKQSIIDAINNNLLDKKHLDISYERIKKVAQNLGQNVKAQPYDKEQHHQKAVEFAQECAVLLKNDNEFLPLNENDKILIIGAFAKHSRIQGGGSSHVKAYKKENFLDCVHNINYEYIEVCDIQGNINSKELDLANGNIDKYKKIIVFAGLPNNYESEGYYRQNINLPQGYNNLIDILSKVHSNIGVVLFNGSPVAMPWINNVKAVLGMNLSGEGSAEACVNILIGLVNPSGKLAESYPLVLEHNPSFLNFPGDEYVDYAEGLFVGYRYYSTKKLPTLFPFGYGLSYTDFEYSNLTTTIINNNIHISVLVKNIGKVEGKNVVQIYIKRTQQNKHLRPIIELKEFQKTNTLKPNESQTLNFVLNRRAFSRYCNRSNGWIVDKGIYEICVANSSEDIVLSQQLELQGDKIPPIKIDDNTTIGELIEHPNTKNFIESIVSKFGNKGNDAISTQMNKAMLFNAPIRLVKNVAKMTDDNYANFKHKIIEDMKK